MHAYFGQERKGSEVEVCFILNLALIWKLLCPSKLFSDICLFFTLLLADMRKPKLSAEIAKQLSSFHQVEIPGSKEPQLWHDIFKFFEKGFSSLQPLF